MEDEESVPSPPAFFRVSGQFTVLNPSRPMVLAKMLENIYIDESQSTTEEKKVGVPDLVFDQKANQNSAAVSTNVANLEFVDDDVTLEDLLPNDMEWEVDTVEDTKQPSSQQELAVDTVNNNKLDQSPDGLALLLHSKTDNKSQAGTTTRRHARWTAEEDDLLRTAVHLEEGPPHNWKLIAENYFHGSRNAFACKGRWNKNLQPGLTHSKWTESEDNIILLGHKAGLSWPQIAQNLNGRPPEQVRNRFLNEIDPTLNRLPFSEAERHQLIELQARYGNKWTQIARKMPGRSEKMVKNYWWNNAKLSRQRNSAKHASTTESK